MPKDFNNSHNNNASDAKHAQLDNNSLETLAKSQDQSVIAMKNTTQQPTDVTDAEPVCSQEMED
jgi:hypothetical protein